MSGDYMLDFSQDNLEDGKEREAVPDGEYTLRLIDWLSDDDGKIKMYDKKDCPFIMPKFEIVGCEEAEYSKDLMHYLKLPNSDMKKKDLNDARFHLNAFFTAFGIDHKQAIDPESCIGLEADALLTIQDDPEYGEQNRVKRWIVSH